jgi:hypothetical protein
MNNDTGFDTDDVLESLNCSIADTLDSTCECNDANVIKEHSCKITANT